MADDKPEEKKKTKTGSAVEAIRKLFLGKSISKTETPNQTMTKLEALEASGDATEEDKEKLKKLKAGGQGSAAIKS
jgi:hypothetical protein